MKTKDRERSTPAAGNTRVAAPGKGDGVGREAPPSDAMARAKALARWENEGGRVAPAGRETQAKR